jgi:hypothetical protein
VHYNLWLNSDTRLELWVEDGQIKHALTTKDKPYSYFVEHYLQADDLQEQLDMITQYIESQGGMVI